MYIQWRLQSRLSNRISINCYMFLYDKDDETYTCRVEYFERCNPTADSKMWRYPK